MGAQTIAVALTPVQSLEALGGGCQQTKLSEVREGVSLVIAVSGILDHFSPAVSTARMQIS